VTEPTNAMIAAVDLAMQTTPGNLWTRHRAAVEAVLAIVERQHQQEVADAFQRGWWRGQFQLCPRCSVELAREVVEENGHRYLSTGCLHGDHDYCKAPTGAAGSKTPASCKFCRSKCVCGCHREAP
jgi:hypothetical protein